MYKFFQLRFLQDQPCQLIYYERYDESGPKMSDYHISFTDKPDELADILTRALGVKGKHTVGLYSCVMF